MKKTLLYGSLLALFISSSAIAQAAAVSLPELITESSKLKSIEYNVAATMDSAITERSITDTFTIKIDAVIKSILKKTPSHSTSFNLSASGYVHDYANTEGDGNVAASLKIDSVFTKNALYFSLKNLSFSPGADEIDSFIKPIKNKWIKISQSDLLDYADSDLLEESSEVPFLETVSGLEKMKVLAFTRQGDSTSLNGKTVQHYVLTINKVLLSEYVVHDFVNENGRAPSAQEKAALLTDINSISLSPIDMWVDEASKLPLRYTGSIGVSETDAYTGSIMKVTAKFDVTVKNVNTVKSIKAPKKSTSIEKLLGDIFR